MKRKFTLILAAVAMLSVVILSTGCQKLKARDELNRRKRVQERQVRGRGRAFQAGCRTRPEFPTARLYLAMSISASSSPGPRPRTTCRWHAAPKRNSRRCWKPIRKTKSPRNRSRAYYNEAQGEPSLDAKIEKLNVASQWYEKLIALNPSKKEGYYTLGVIAWMKTYPRRMAVRSELGMKPDAPGPIKDKKKLEELRTKNLESVEKGIEALNKAINIDNEYDDAMAYINLLYRERADLQPTAELYDQDIEKADNWVEKSLSIKKIKAAREAEKGGGGVVKD